MQLIATGFLDKGTPYLKFSLEGIADPKEVTAIIDTGFSGFVSMPLIQAFPLGLPLYGTTNVQLADGQTQTKLLASGKAHFADRQRVGLVVLEPGKTDALVGMDFLRTFGLALFVAEVGVGLYDETEVQKAAQASQNNQGTT